MLQVSVTILNYNKISWTCSHYST